MTVCAGIADNPQPLVAWTVVLKPLSEPACLCVHGALAGTDAWLDAAMAQMPEGTTLVLLGASTALDGHGEALRFGDLLDASAEALARA
ncbi:MAG: hypothetical protein WAU14_07225, partial [Dokdonella sp.]